MIAEFFKQFSFKLSKFTSLPVIRAYDDDDEEEELQDPYTGLKAECMKKEEGIALKRKLDECNARVRSRKKTAETCEEELHDLVEFVDHCAAKNLFKYLK